MHALQQISPEMIRRLQRDEYEKLVELGLFDNERVELLHGMVVQMSPKGAAHDATVQRLTRLLVLALAGRAEVRIQSALALLDDAQPEPDVAVVAPGSYDDSHPRSASLVIEVAKSSLRTDRTTKGQIYATAGVREYWIVNLVDHQIEVHTDIVDGVYTRTTPYRLGQLIKLQTFDDVELSVADVLPRSGGNYR